MRLLEVFNRYLERGGEELAADQIAARLVGRHVVDRLAFDSRVWTGKGRLWQLVAPFWLFHNPISAKRLRKRLQTVRADVLVAHNIFPVASPAVYEVARLEGVPVVQFCHNYRPYSVSGTFWVDGKINDSGLRGDYWPEVSAGTFRRSRLATALLALAMARLRRSKRWRSVARFVPVSEFVGAKFVEGGVEPARVCPLRHAWEAPLTSPGDMAEGDYYLMLARLVPEKGVLTVLAAWSELVQSQARPPRLIIAGTGPLEAAVRAAGPAVEAVGWVNGADKARLLAGARAVLVPSLWWEPQPMVVYEAYAAGKPVLASAVGGLVEAIRHGQTGLLVTPGHATALAEAIQQAEAVGREGRSAWGAAGQAWLRDEADPRRWLDRFDAILEAARGDAGG